MSSGFLFSTFGLNCTLFIFGIFLVTLCLQKVRLELGFTKFLIYVINIVIVYVGVYDSLLIQEALGNPLKDDAHQLLFDVAVAWSAIRAISFGVTSKSDDSISTMCCYFLYLPCLIVGPITNYTTFALQIENNLPSPIRTSMKQALSSGLKAIAWFASMEVLLHTVYPMATRFDYYAVREQLTTVEYFGFSAILMAHFYVKYLLMYGLAEEAALVEGIWLPERPRCTLRLSSGAEVWRTFDRGLYLWFLELIYIPLGGSFVASVLCFVFVCFWHSFSVHVQIWCTLNFVLVVIEKLISRYPTLLQVVLQCPLHWLAVGSNMFYLGGPDIGFDFFDKLREPRTLCCAFVVSLFACVVGRYFKDKDRTLYRASAERVHAQRKAQ